MCSTDARTEISGYGFLPRGFHGSCVDRVTAIAVLRAISARLLLEPAIVWYSMVVCIAGGGCKSARVPEIVRMALVDPTPLLSSTTAKS